MYINIHQIHIFSLIFWLKFLTKSIFCVVHWFDACHVRLFTCRRHLHLHLQGALCREGAGEHGRADKAIPCLRRSWWHFRQRHLGQAAERSEFSSIIWLTFITIRISTGAAASQRTWTGSLIDQGWEDFRIRVCATAVPRAAAQWAPSIKAASPKCSRTLATLWTHRVALRSPLPVCRYILPSLQLNIKSLSELLFFSWLRSLCRCASPTLSIREIAAWMSFSIQFFHYASKKGGQQN